MAADRRGHARAPAGVHQPRELPPGTRARSAQGHRRTTGARGLPRFARAEAPRRNHPAQPAGRVRRNRPGRLAAGPPGHRGAPAPLAGLTRPQPGLEGAGVHARRLGVRRRPSGARACAPEHETGSGHGAQERQRRGRTADARPVAQRPRHRAAHRLDRAAGRRGPLPPKLPAGAGGRSGLRPGADGDHDRGGACHTVYGRRRPHVHQTAARPLQGAAGNRGTRPHRQPAAEHPEHPVARLQRRRASASGRPRRVHCRPRRSGRRLLRRDGDPHSRRPELQRRRSTR